MTTGVYPESVARPVLVPPLNSIIFEYSVDWIVSGIPPSGELLTPFLRVRYDRHYPVYSLIPVSSYCIQPSICYSSTLDGSWLP